MDKNAGRRAFLKVGGTAAAGLLGRTAGAQQPAGVPPPAPALATRNLG